MTLAFITLHLASLGIERDALVQRYLNALFKYNERESFCFNVK